MNTLRDALPAREFTVVFDGECGICGRSVAWIRDRDREGRFEFLPFQDPEVPRRYPEVDPADFEGALQLFTPEGTRFQGARAAEEILRLLPGWRAAHPLFRIPGVRTLARWVYARVARNRHRLGCGEHCTISDRNERLSE